MKNLLEQAIKEAEYKLQQPNFKVDGYRAYWGGRMSLAKEFLASHESRLLSDGVNGVKKDGRYRIQRPRQLINVHSDCHFVI